MSLYPKLRLVSHLLALQVVIDLRDGKIDDALPFAQMMLRLRKGIDDEPGIINKLGAFSLDDNAFRVLKEFRGKQFTNLSALRELIRTLSRRERDNSIGPAMKGERTFALNRVFPSIGSNYRLSLSAIERYYYLLEIDRYIQFAQEDIRTVAQNGSLQPHFSDPSAPFYLPRICLVSRPGLPIFTKARVAEAVMDAKTNLAYAAIALEVHRIEKGDYPDDLFALSPSVVEKVPEDLFSGKSLAYKRYGDDYLLYSVGPNRTDEGGTQPKDTAYYEDGDLAWAAPMIQTRPRASAELRYH